MPPAKKAASAKTESGGKKKSANGHSVTNAPREATSMASTKKNRLTETPKPVKMTNGPTETEIKQWLIRATDLQKDEKEAKSAMGSVRQAQGILKKDIKKAGGDYDDFKFLFASTQMTQDDAEARLNRIVGYHQAINIRVSFDKSGQGTLDDVVTEAPKNTTGTRDLDEARAESDGFNSGRQGAAPDDNPFHAGSRQYVGWEKGRSDGAKDQSRKIPA